MSSLIGPSGNSTSKNIRGRCRMSAGYEDFKAKFIGTLAATGYDGDQEAVIIDAYVAVIENAWESAELRADRNYADLLEAQEKLEALISVTPDEYIQQAKEIIGDW